MTDKRILSLIPHRPPFLWVDRIISQTETVIETEITFHRDLEVFRGHYPGTPLLPGVLLCEAIFQSGALLLAGSLSDMGDTRLPVLTRITDARFKRRVLPGETAHIVVSQIDSVSSVFVLRGKAKVDDQLALKTEFCCALIDA